MSNLAAAGVACWIAITAAAAGAPAPTGPDVGQQIPPFALPDQYGKTQTLDTIAGPKGAMLLFFRSADW